MDGLYYETVSLYGMGEKDISVTKMKQLISEANSKDDNDLLDKIRNWAEAIDEKEKIKVLKFLNNVDRIQTEYIEKERNHKDVKNIEPRGINEIENKLDELYLNSGIKKGQSLKEFWDSNIDKHDLFRIYKMSFTLAYRQDNRDEATEIANEFKEYADIVGDRAFTTEAIYQQAMIKYGSKLFEAGKNLLLKAVQVAEESGNENLLLKIDDDVNTANFPHEDMKERVKKALSEVQLGEPDQGEGEDDLQDVNQIPGIRKVNVKDDQAYLTNDLLETGELKLGFENYVNAFSSLISEEAKTDQLVVGLHGEWGRGKSTLMHHINKMLVKKGHTTVTLNAWKYESKENIWAAFIHALISQVSSRVSIFWWPYYKFNLFRHKHLIKVFAILFIVSIVYLISITLGAHYTSLLSTNQITLFAIVVFFVLLIIKQGYRFYKIVKDLGFNWKEVFKKIDYSESLGVIGKIDDDLNTLKKLFSRVKGNKKPIVIFIDDLDRCPPNRIVEVVNAINTLTLNKGFIFFIGYDRDYVASAIASEYQDMIGRYHNEDESNIQFGYEFLDKIIQVPFRIPIADRNSIKLFVKDYLEIKETVQKPSTSELSINNKRTPEDKSGNEKKIESEEEDMKDFGSVDSQSEIKESLKPDVLNAVANAILQEAIDNYDFNNPRKIKKFVNTFKLLSHIANEAGMFSESGISPRQLGFTMFFQLNYPDEIELLYSTNKTDFEKSSLKKIVNNDLTEKIFTDVNKLFVMERENTKMIKQTLNFISGSLT